MGLQKLLKIHFGILIAVMKMNAESLTLKWLMHLQPACFRPFSVILEKDFLAFEA